MRDPKRIERICELLKECWSKHPDLRLGQLLFGCKQKATDIYYIEDDKWEEWIKDYCK